MRGYLNAFLMILSNNIVLICIVASVWYEVLADKLLFCVSCGQLIPLFIMSGGAKKKPTKTQGWEEAGSEFYQESYPAADGELDVFQKDPQHLATLLPSKQTRAGTNCISVIFMYNNWGNEIIIDPSLFYCQYFMLL